MKRLISILLTVVMILSVLAAAIPVGAESRTAGGALKFKSGLDNLWRTEKSASAMPRTFEATIDVPSTFYDNYEGQILAFYSIYHENHYVFVDLLRKNASNGNEKDNLSIRLLVKNGTTEATKVYYDALNNYFGQKIHVAFTVDTSVNLYINGELYNGGTFYTAAADEAAFVEIYNGMDYTKIPNLCLGGDDRNPDPAYDKTNFHNFRFFKGGIYNACVFSDVRSQSEIKSDMSTLPTSGADNLMMSYDTAEESGGVIPDKSGNGYNLKKGVFYGRDFKSGFENLYTANKKIEVLPKTLEATITVPNLTGGSRNIYEGDILAFYDANSPHIILDMVRKDANNSDKNDNLGLRLLCNDGTSDRIKVFYDVFNGYLGQTIHIAVVIDTSVKLYINGELYTGGSYCRQGSTVIEESAFVSTYNSLNVADLNLLTIGGDNRPAVLDQGYLNIIGFDNYRYFRGKVFNVSIFSDVRTAAEIVADNNTLPVYGADKLMMSFDFHEESSARVVPDKSGNGYYVSATPKWLDPEYKTPVTGYGYSFVVVGDTQVVTIDEVNKGDTYDGNFNKIYDYIVNNAKDKNIQFMFHMGDVTDNSKTEEWEIAMEGINKLNVANIAYNIVRGNHDTATAFVNYYTTDAYINAVVDGEEYGFFISKDIPGYQATTLNAYQTITIGNVMYLMLSLDMGPCKAVIKWANEVVAAHPYHNVIISTHSYLQGDNSTGTYMDAPKDCSATQYNYGGYYNGKDYESNGNVYIDPTTGKGVDWDFRLPSHEEASFKGNKDYDYQDATYMLNNLVREHSNISMVLCGHECSEYVKQVSTKGKADNTVLQFLVDGQLVDRQLQQAGEDHAGLVALFYFSEDGKRVTTEYYSTIREQYLHDDENTQTYDVNVVEVPQTVQTFYSLMHSLDENDYTAEEWNTITAQLATTKAVVVNKESNANAIEASVSELQAVVLEANLEYGELETAVDAAEELDENDYSESAWAEIREAVSEAKQVLAGATSQTQIDETKTALNTLISSTAKINRADLAEAIDTAATKYRGDYTADSWAAFEAALADARAKLSSRDQSEIDSAQSALMQAMMMLAKNTIKVDGGSASMIVNGTYIPGSSASKVVSVDVSWGSMTFTYNASSEGRWDDKTHTYVEQSTPSWEFDTDANKVTVTNHSNTVIEAQLSFTNASGTNIVGVFTDSVGDTGDGKMTIASAVGTNVNQAPSAYAHFNITSGDITSNGKIGSITLKIVSVS